MDKSRSRLQEAGIVILFLAGISFIRTIVDMILGFRNLEVDAAKGITEGVIIAAIIVVGVLGILILLPQLYIGVKGIKAAADPSISIKTATLWAKILLVVCVICLAAPIASIINTGRVIDNALELADLCIDIAAFYYFIYAAKGVAKA